MAGPGSVMAGAGTATPDALALAGVRLVLAAVFLLAALAKVASPSDFVAKVANYRLVPQGLVGIVAAAVIATELGAGALLAVDLLTPWAGGAAAVLLGAFALAMTLNLLRHRRIACGCAATDRAIGWGLVSRDVVLAVAAVAVALSSPPVPLDASVAVVITVGAALAGCRLVDFVRRAGRLQRLLVDALEREPSCPGRG